MARRAPPQRPRNLLESPARQGPPRLLHALLQCADLEFPRRHVRGDIELAGRGERGVGGLGGQSARIESFGALASSGGLWGFPFEHCACLGGLEWLPENEVQVWCLSGVEAK